MRIRLLLTWQNESLYWILCTAIALLLGFPLILRAMTESRIHPIDLSAALPANKPADKTKVKQSSSQQPKLNVPVGTSLGQSSLDLNLLSTVFALDEADNVRWSLIRRTPTAVQVYDTTSGVNWQTLRTLSASGTILVLAGSDWSFNETFQEGPGYKVADGILAGGHCSLATVFKAAATKAGLPSESNQHSVAIPGFTLAQSVNIYWGSDDLVIHNTTGRDLLFAWTLTPQDVNINVVTADPQKSLPPLPDWRNQTIAMIYGHPAPGGWGSIGQVDIADATLFLARNYAQSVSGWNGGKSVVIAINPNVAQAGSITDRPEYYQYLINEARRQGYYVMLDVQTGSQDPVQFFNTVMDTFLQDNVWLDWDIEHTDSVPVDAREINRVAAAYFARRTEKGFTTPGIFSFYVFGTDQITNPQNITRQYDNGDVVPIFDGFGGSGNNPAQDKIDITKQILSLFQGGPFGIMEFQSLWNNTYDKISAKDYFQAFPLALIMASQ